jgi:hypothetical protein
MTSRTALIVLLAALGTSVTFSTWYSLASYAHKGSRTAGALGAVVANYSTQLFHWRTM